MALFEPRIAPRSGRRAAESPRRRLLTLPGEDSVIGEDDLPRHSEPRHEPPLHPDPLVEPERMRVDPGRKGMLALAGVAAAIVIYAGVTYWRDAPAPAAVSALPVAAVASETLSAPPPPPAPPAEMVVSVVGAVARPGLVTLPMGARVADALAAAGGPAADVDTTALNLAERMSDGQQIVVGLPAASLQVPAVQSAPTPGAPAPGAAPGPVPLNTATVGDLDALPGVGPVTAAAIIAWRETNGPFTSVDQLAEINGIGPTRLARLRTLVRV